MPVESMRCQHRDRGMTAMPRPYRRSARGCRTLACRRSDGLRGGALRAMPGPSPGAVPPFVAAAVVAAVVVAAVVVARPAVATRAFAVVTGGPAAVPWRCRLVRGY